MGYEFLFGLQGCQFVTIGSSSNRLGIQWKQRSRRLGPTIRQWWLDENGTDRVPFLRGNELGNTIQLRSSFLDEWQ